MNLTMKQKNLYMLLCGLFGTTVILSSLLLNTVNHYINAFLLVLTAIVLYFLMVLVSEDKNWLDLRAVFTGVWIGTIGLATFRLTGYQEVWQKKTWVLLAAGYLVFQIGANLGIYCGKKYFNTTKFRFKKDKKIYFSLRENRLFWIALVTTLIGLCCFIISIAIKGYIPCFSDDQLAYINFYTKFHMFSVAATMSSGLCYYCIKIQPISNIKKIILWLCIFYNVILFPIMVVSRGVFVTSALILTSVVFYLNKKRFMALVLCLVLIMGVYLFTSTLRNYADEQLSVLFNPIEIETPVLDKDKENNTNDSEVQNDYASFELSPKMAFLYGYLTVGHDNVNEAVQNLDEYTWGTRSLNPFNVILRSKTFDKISNSVENHFVRPYLNTNNLIGTAYYDFHEYGVVVFMLLLSFVLALLQIYCEKFKNPFILLAMSNTVQVSVLSFFENFTARFEFWVFWGVVLIFAFAACININIKKQNDSNSYNDDI